VYDWVNVRQYCKALWIKSLYKRNPFTIYHINPHSSKQSIHCLSSLANVLGSLSFFNDFSVVPHPASLRSVHGTLSRLAQWPGPLLALYWFALMTANSKALQGAGVSWPNMDRLSWATLVDTVHGVVTHPVSCLVGDETFGQ